jgi:hypothetical protein
MPQLTYNSRRSSPRAAALTLAVAALAGSLLLSASAYAKEVAYNESIFARFNNGHVGIVRIGLEKDANSRARAKVHVWCARSGAVRVPCDAIRFYDGLSVQKWAGDANEWQSVLGQGLVRGDDSPPVNGLEFATDWECPGPGDGTGWYGSWRAVVSRFRAAANDQWSKVKTRVSRTYKGGFC